MSEENNWKVEFQNAAGQDIFDAAGYKNPVTMDLVTEDTFVHLGLVQMAHADDETQSFGCDVIPLSDTWEKAVVTAEDFGLKDVEVRKSDIGQDAINNAYNQAYLERQASGNAGPDVAGDVFG
ncbi:MAG: hypothetical protein ACLFR0_00440 [Alphaproteobacteria bacterium]